MNPVMAKGPKGTYHIVSVGGAINQADLVPQFIGDEHVETLSEAELAHHIVRKVTEPIAHVLHISLLVVGFKVAIIASQDSAQLTHMEEHHVFHSLESILRECLAEDSPLAPVHSLINGVVGVVHALDGRKRIIERGLLQTLAVAIYVVKSTIRVDRDKVRCDPNVGSILVVQLVQP